MSENEMVSGKSRTNDATQQGAQALLFALGAAEPRPERPKSCARSHPKQGVRLKEAERSQLSWGRVDLDAALPEEHPARAIWAVIERLDLSALYSDIEARDGVAGASAIDPKILLALWVYATSEGEGSAREIWRLCEVHAAYRWISGGVDVGYHTLSDFRSQRAEITSDLITQVLALLMKQNLVDLSRVAQDGTRVRASAGAASFRRQQTLEALMAEARAHLEQVSKEADPAMSARRAAARKRGAAERLERLQAALAQVPELTEIKKRSGAKDKTARVSTTDADARVMKMGDGGFRPAYNIQFATTADRARVIVGVDATKRGSDMGESTKMIEQIEKRTGVRPREMLVDGGYAAHEAIDEATDKQVTIYAPLPKLRKGGAAVDPKQPRTSDSEAVAAWRERMATEPGRDLYKQRAATAETVNADAKTHRGLDQFAVRGLPKALGSASLFALSYNILRFISLGG